MTTEEHVATGDHRVQFDFEIDFSNGGGIQGQGFRLDIDGDDISDEELADSIVRDLRLLMVGEVRVRTGWDRHWRTDVYFHGHPFLTAAAADHLAAEGAALAGIDSLNIDDTSSGERPVHSTLLAAGIPICEHLTNLAALPIDRFRFSAVPVKVRGMGTFPVRAYATIQGDGQG